MDIDWNATAAWIALAISVTGTIVSPLITTYLTNKHQREMRLLDIKQTAETKYIDNRDATFNTFVAKVGQVMAYPDKEAMKDFGDAYFAVYSYVPDSFWPKLDMFYKNIIQNHFDDAKKMYPEIIHMISSTAKEERPEIHIK